MTLKDKLYEMKAEMESNIPNEIKDIMQRANRQLELSGILEKGLKVGDEMIDIMLTDSTGNKIQLSSVLKKGPMVLTFFRGQW